MNKLKLNTIELTKFALFGALMYAQKAVLASLPNIHLTAVLITAFTVVYRVKALYPLLIYVFLEGLFSGFTVWWIPYLYIWPILWGAVMLLPKDLINKKFGALIYMLVCSLHGFLFGTLFTPAYALILGMNFEESLAWIASGLPYDMIHGISNFCLGILIVPIIKVLLKLEMNIGATQPEANAGGKQKETKD